MSYLRIRNFWNYQNADAWNKAEKNRGGHRHPAWCKLLVHRDMELDLEPPLVRLVFLELLRLATVHANAIPKNEKAIAKAISLPTQQVGQAIHRLLEAGWINESNSARRSRIPSRGSREARSPRAELKQEKEKELTKGSTSEIDAEHAIEKLLQAVNTKDEREVSLLRGHAVRLPEGAVVKVAESVTGNGVRNRVAYALGALKDEARMRS